MQAIIISIFTWFLGSFLGKVLLGAGLTLLTATGVSTLVETALNGLSAYFAGVPADILSFVVMSGVPAGMSLIGSAILTRVFLQAGSRIVGMKVAGS